MTVQLGGESCVIPKHCAPCAHHAPVPTLPLHCGFYAAVFTAVVRGSVSTVHAVQLSAVLYMRCSKCVRCSRCAAVLIVDVFVGLGCRDRGTGAMPLPTDAGATPSTQHPWASICSPCKVMVLSSAEFGTACCSGMDFGGSCCCCVWCVCFTLSYAEARVLRGIRALTHCVSSLRLLLLGGLVPCDAHVYTFAEGSIQVEGGREGGREARTYKVYAP